MSNDYWSGPNSQEDLTQHAETANSHTGVPVEEDEIHLHRATAMNAISQHLSAGGSIEGAKALASQHSVVAHEFDNLIDNQKAKFPDAPQTEQDRAERNRAFQQQMGGALMGAAALGALSNDSQTQDPSILMASGEIMKQRDDREQNLQGLVDLINLLDIQRQQGIDVEKHLSSRDADAAVALGDGLSDMVMSAEIQRGDVQTPNIAGVAREREATPLPARK